MADLVQQCDRFGAGIDEIGFLRPQWFQAKPDAAISDAGQGSAKGIGGVMEGLSTAGARRNAALGGRAKNHDRAAQIAATASQFHEVVGSPAAGGFIGGGHLETCRSGQQPMQADDGDTRFLGLATEESPPLGGDVRHERGQREGSNLQSIIAKIGNQRAGANVIPVCKSFIANCVTHGVANERGMFKVVSVRATKITTSGGVYPRCIPAGINPAARLF